MAKTVRCSMIIGAGPGGYTAAMVAEFGLKAVVIEAKKGSAEPV